MGSWDAFRPKSILAPRPVPSVLYYYRKYFGNKAAKLAVVKEVKNLLGLGLKEAKELVESTPKQIQEGVTKETGEDIKKQIEDIGGKVSLV